MLASDDSRLDFGYSFLWSHGHGLLAGALALVAFVLIAAGVTGWVIVLFAAGAIWAWTGYLLLRLVFRAHRPMKMPTARFMNVDEGEILDLGCGSGRTSIMVAQARPGVHVTALDNFSAKYIRDHGEARLFRNLEIAGVKDRVTLQRGDMLSLPFEDESFDGAVSSYALDHLKSHIPRALSEASRVLKPDGQFLLMVILPDLYMNICYPGVVGLAFPTMNRWHRMFREAGFEVVLEDAPAGGGWFLLKRI